jgi:putative ABC transport system ATP-binding protein
MEQALNQKEIKKDITQPNVVASGSKKNILEVYGVNKVFHVGVQDIQVLKSVSVNIQDGDFVILVGPSGCGKSTLLHIVLGLEEPSNGYVNFMGEDLYKNKDEDTRSDFRKKNVGMVFQQSNWIRSLNVQENVAFPLLLLGYDKPKALIIALEMLKKVNMEGWAKYMPTELSSGQQQRVGLARALVNDPKLIIADEPTGNLDYDSGQTVMKLFYDLNHASGKTVIMVTHDLEYVKFASTIVRMFDGQIIGIYGEGDKEKLISELKFKRLGDVAKKNDDLDDVPADSTKSVDEQPIKKEAPRMFKVKKESKVVKKDIKAAASSNISSETKEVTKQPVSVSAAAGVKESIT